jgi:hypothetical protein
MGEPDNLDDRQDDLCDQPGRVIVHGDAVVLFLPVNGGAALTRKAALATAEMLIAAARGAS